MPIYESNVLTNGVNILDIGGDDIITRLIELVFRYKGIGRMTKYQEREVGKDIFHKFGNISPKPIDFNNMETHILGYFNESNYMNIKHYFDFNLY